MRIPSTTLIASTPTAVRVDGGRVLDGALLAHPAQIPAEENTVRPIRNIRLRLHRSPSRAAVIKATAKASRYVADIHAISYGARSEIVPNSGQTDVDDGDVQEIEREG